MGHQEDTEVDGHSLAITLHDAAALKRREGFWRRWAPARLDAVKALGCFTEIIAYKTRLFVPVATAAEIVARLTA